MKKTLAAVAVLGAFAGSALAADVTLYGKVDLGLQYTHTEIDFHKSGLDTLKSDNYEMKSGGNSTSRIGLKGVEDISEGVKVGFQLEQGIKADKNASTSLFDRESRLYVATDYGTLHMGRFGRLDAGSGSLDGLGDLVATGTGYGDIADLSTIFYVADPSREANSIAYPSPVFAGVKLSAMASLGDGEADIIKGVKGEGSSDVNRYYGLGLEGSWGPLGAGLLVSTEDWADSVKDQDDSLNLTAGVNYDFGVLKAYVAGNYYDPGIDDCNRWGVAVGAEAPLAGGNLEVTAGYGKVKAGDAKSKAVIVGTMYTYPLSKRTYVYGGMGYSTADDVAIEVDTKKFEMADIKGAQAVFGLTHNF